VPVILIVYEDWTREMLEAVGAFMKAGIILVSGRRATGEYDLYLGTRECPGVASKEDGETHVLRAPAWDAHLKGVEAQAYARFTAMRNQQGGFRLLVQTPGWELSRFVCEPDDHVVQPDVTRRPCPEQN
ncbi:MAG: hypothetical protein ACYSUI_17620, partial [Planctomycetota bacterium]